MTGAPVLVFAPHGRDATVVRQMLAAGGVEAVAVEAGGMLERLKSGDAGAVVLTDEALAGLDRAHLAQTMINQPPWSDFPFVLLTHRGSGSQHGSRLVEQLGNVTLLERPLHPATLLSAVRSALRARRRQLEALAHLRERDAAEQRLRDLAATLEEKVADRTQALAAANVRLRTEIAERKQAQARLLQAQKMESIGQLTGGIAHDFNNLLTAVVGSLELLLKRTTDERVIRLANNAMHAADRGARLTAQLLAFSRRQLLDRTAVDVNGLVAGMHDLLGRTIGGSVEIETRLDPDSPHALADRTQLEVMLLNLAINARDAMPAGGKLIISTRKTFAAEAEDVNRGPYVVISVCDTGDGMSPEVVARAFEPFYTTKAVGKGTGLGLSQVYGIARQLGGTARIESTQGSGACVEIYLPFAISDPETAVAGPAQATAGQSGRILIVDDDPDVRAVALDMVEHLGYDAIAASGAEEALAILKAEPSIDLVLTDIAMPGMNGFQFAELARKLRADLNVLFASGYADVDQFGEGLEVEELVKKPYSLSQLAAQLAKGLQKTASG